MEQKPIGESDESLGITKESDHESTSDMAVGEPACPQAGRFEM